MKANRKGWKKKALAATLLFGMAAGAFGVGFSAFVLSDPSLGEVGSLDVTFGDAAFIEMDRASASCFSCAPRGFLQSDGKTYGPQASMSVSFAYYVHSEQSFRLDFSLRQEEATPARIRDSTCFPRSPPGAC